MLSMVTSAEARTHECNEGKTSLEHCEAYLAALELHQQQGQQQGRPQQSSGDCETGSIRILGECMPEAGEPRK